MGWIERLEHFQDPSQSNNTALVARRIFRGLNFTESKVQAVERELGLHVDYDSPLIEHALEICKAMSYGKFGTEGPRRSWRVKVLPDEMGRNVYANNREVWLKLAKPGCRWMAMGRKEKSNDAMAYIVCDESDVPEVVKRPKCTLLDRDLGKLVFVKEVESAIRDLSLTEGWGVPQE